MSVDHLTLEESRIQLIATSLDKALINGSGTGSEPLGILNTTGVNTVTAVDTSGKVPNYQELVKLFGLVWFGCNCKC
jgi:HK97 family phage major capsid protein